MTVVVVTSQPGLGYCLNLDEVFIGDCHCEDVVPPDLSAEDPCTCCSDHSPEVEDKQPSPCRDCSLSLHLDLDDFIVASSLRTPNPDEAGLTISQFLSERAPLSLDSKRAIRRSPPPSSDLLPPIVPRKRATVFLI